MIQYIEQFTISLPIFEDIWPNNSERLPKHGAQCASGSEPERRLPLPQWTRTLEHMTRRPPAMDTFATARRSHIYRLWTLSQSEFHVTKR